MAKAYVCDACGVVIPDPFEVHMREFFVAATYDCGVAVPFNYTRRKTRVHLCEDCWRSLRTIAAQIQSEEKK